MVAGGRGAAAEGLAARRRRSGMRRGAIWISGLSASGKSTLAEGLVGRLTRAGVEGLVLLDGEALRARLPRRYGHSLADREAVLRLIVAEAARVAGSGQIPVVATISHRREMRRHARERLAPLLLVCLDCPPEVCAARDPKGHYARAAAGDYACFIGVTHPYEPEPRADLVLDTARLSPAAALDRLARTAARFLARVPAEPRV